MCFNGNMLREILCALGLILCGYLLYLTEYFGICLGHCNLDYYTLGLVWFLLGILIRDGRLLNIWAIVGLVGVAYFVTLEIFEGFCLYCTILHILGIMSIFSLKIDRRLQFHRKLFSTVKTLRSNNL